jgi:hypothetical protein
MELSLLVAGSQQRRQLVCIYRATAVRVSLLEQFRCLPGSQVRAHGLARKRGEILGIAVQQAARRWRNKRERLGVAARHPRRQERGAGELPAGPAA